MEATFVRVTGVVRLFQSEVRTFVNGREWDEIKWKGS